MFWLDNQAPDLSLGLQQLILTKYVKNIKKKHTQKTHRKQIP